MNKTIYNVGYIGEGDYKVSIGKNKTVQYAYWSDMLKRCYSEKYLERKPTYKDCLVCEEWHCFQTFAKWFDENYYECNDGQIMNLDKDILYKNNKIYSPDTCVFVPDRINLLFTKRQNDRGEYPIGVYSPKDRSRFKSQCSIFINDKSKQKYLGTFDTPEEAFYDGYKPFKESYIKQVANEYKNFIPKKLYEAMYRYVVEITD